MKNLCLAGGVALNCVANGRILREGHFEDIWIQPAAGDAGGALGAALFVWHQLSRTSRGTRTAAGLPAAARYLGPAFADDEIETFLNERRASVHRASPEAELLERVADLIAAEKVVGWFQGRMEFGPRALGGRSILGDARSPEMQAMMNLKIKFRGVLPPVRPLGACASDVARVFRAGRATAPTCCWSRRCETSTGASWPEDETDALRASRSSTGPLDDPGRHPRRLLRPGADRRRARTTRSTTTLIEAFQEQDRLPGHHQHVVQRPRRADRLHARGRLPLLHAHEHGLPGARRVPAGQEGPAPAAEDVDWRTLFELD